jgi:Clostripain family
MTTPNLEWTVMIYMAADNDLAPFAIKNFDQIQQTGSTDKVHVLVQIDSPIPGLRMRTFIPIGGGQGTPVDIPDINTGSVADFVNFVRWVDDGHRAKRYLIVLWGHGQGVSDFPGDEAPTNVGTLTAGNGATPDFSPQTAVLSTPGNRAHSLAAAAAPARLSSNPAHMVGKVMEVEPLAILNDHNDALTSRELKEALIQAREVLGLGQEKIHIVGMDACLMSMAEVARQLSEAAGLMVSSEQTIPDASWPYGNILQKLVKNPQLQPEELADLIVDEYVAFYEAPDHKEQVTLSVCDLAETKDLTDTIARLVVALRKSLHSPDLRLAVVKARQSALSFFISDFVDLYDFCRLMKSTLDTDFEAACQTAKAVCDEIRGACGDVMQLIRPDNGKRFVLKSAVSFPDTNPIRNASGVSIYFPLILPLYSELDLNKEAHWNEFLRDYIDTFFFQTSQSGAISKVANFSHEQNDNNGNNSEGGIKAMKSKAATAPARSPCLVLLNGTVIEDRANNFSTKLTGVAFLDMTPNPKVHVPEGTDLDIPGTGKVKAITGTPVKSMPGTQIKGVQKMVVPACTLREAKTGNPTRALGDGTKVTAKNSDSPIIALAELDVVAP